ncbi:UNVERIFIED_CONTAM: hypothetical protein FKN15_072824 [Acipenser sinensis]
MRRELFLVIWLAPQPVLTLQAGWPEIFVGESVTLRCEIARQAGGWRYSWYRDGIPVRETYSDRLDGANYTIRDASRYHSGDYTCRVDRSSSPAHQSMCSDPVKILVSKLFSEPVLELVPGTPVLGKSLTLRCLSQLTTRKLGTGLRYYFLKEGWMLGMATLKNVFTWKAAQLRHTGSYKCKVTADGTSVVMLSSSVQVGFTADSSADKLTPHLFTDPVEEDYESSYRPGPTDFSTAHSIHTDHSLPDSPSLSHPSLPDTSNPTAHSLPDSPSLSYPSLPDTSNPTAHSLPDSPSLSHPSLPDTSNPTAHSLPDSPSLSHPSLPDTSIHTDHSITITADPITSNHSHLSLLNTVSPSEQPLSDTPHPTSPVQTELDTDWSSQMTPDSTV